MKKYSHKIQVFSLINHAVFNKTETKTVLLQAEAQDTLVVLMELCRVKKVRLEAYSSTSNKTDLRQS